MIAKMNHKVNENLIKSTAQRNGDTMTDFDEENVSEIITEMKISRQDINSGRLNT